jgi:hypothetical protein
VKSLSYRLDSGAWTEQSGSSAVFTLSSEAVQTVTFYATDKAGNKEAEQSLVVRIDRTKPATSFAQSPAVNAAGWNQAAVTVTLSASDNLSGVGKTYYTVDGGAKQSYGSPFQVSGDAAHTVVYWSEDVAGNSEAQKSATVRIDGTAPATMASASPAPNAAGWNRGDVTVTLSASDDTSGVAKRYYAIDGGAQQTYSAPFTVSGDAVHTVKFWSEDLAGNVEPASSKTLKIDTTSPASSLAASPAPNAAGWNNGAVSVTLSATDNLSGVAATFYTVDGGAKQSYAGVFTVSGDAVHTVVYWSEDVAGNAEAGRSYTIRIDTTAPGLTAAASPSELWPPNGKMVPVTVSGKVTDGLSGLNPGTLTYTVKDEYGQVQPSGTFQAGPGGSYAFTIQLEARRDGQDKDGRTYTILVQATDAAGNATSATVTVTVPHDNRK